MDEAIIPPQKIRPFNATAGSTCPACHKPFAEGDRTTLVALGPGDSEEARERCRQGRPYNAVALEVHWACVTGQA